MPGFLKKFFSTPARALGDEAAELLTVRGEASGVSRAAEFLSGYASLDAKARLEFLRCLAEDFGPEERRLAEAVDEYRSRPDDISARALHDAAEPRRQELLRRLNLAPGGTAALVRMREDLLRHMGANPALAQADADFVHLFGSWFNRGFLVLRRIDWQTPAAVLEKIIRYEAVHEINGWPDLRRRLDPPDRRCFGFFHPALVDEPLIFVEVALTRGIPEAIAPLLDDAREPLPAGKATTAVFYSISNCQPGLRGISFGNFLIKQVVEDLRRDFPQLKTFVTLSPVPGFAGWLKTARAGNASPALSEDDRAELKALDTAAWTRDDASREALRPVLSRAVARYLLEAKSKNGKPLDPVARFHLGNGARLERVNFLGDVSAKGLREAAGFMVNYLYDLDDIERNHEQFENRGAIAASRAVERLLRERPRPR